MNFDQLRHFSEIARCGSLNQATAALYVSQPSLSSSIKKLEKELGEQLFVRHNNGVTLTPFGEELLPYVRNVLNLMDQIPSQAFGKNAASRPRLSVCNGGFKFVTAAVSKVYEAHREDGVHIDFYDVSREETLSMVEAGTAQVGAFAMYDFQAPQMLRRLEDADLAFVKLADAPITVTVGRKNPLYDRKEDWVTMDMIQDYPILYKFAEHSSSLQRRLGITQSKSVINCRTRAGRAELLSATDCYTIGAVPTLAYRTTDFYADHRIFRVKDVDFTSQFGYVQRKSMGLSWLAEEFVQHLKELFVE